MTVPLHKRHAIKDGRFAVIRGIEYELKHFGGYGWYAWSPKEAPNFEQHIPEIGRPTFRYFPGPGEVLACVEYRSRAVYRGLELEAEATGNGKFLVVVDTSYIHSSVTDQQANEAGLDFREPGLWSKVVELDDPDLVVTTTRTPIRPPWLPAEDSQ